MTMPIKAPKENKGPKEGTKGPVPIPVLPPPRASAWITLKCRIKPHWVTALNEAAVKVSEREDRRIYAADIVRKAIKQYLEAEGISTEAAKEKVFQPSALSES